MTGSAQKRRAASLFEEPKEKREEEAAEVGSGAALLSGELSFNPLYMISSWKERRTMNTRLCVAIILPYRVGASNFTISVVGGGGFLQLRARWPTPLLDVLVLHRWKLSDADRGFMPYHHSVLGFEATLSELRKRSSDVVESIASIPLPFAVVTQVVAKNNLSFREGGTKMLYVDSRAGPELPMV